MRVIFLVLPMILAGVVRQARGRRVTVRIGLLGAGPDRGGSTPARSPGSGRPASWPCTIRPDAAEEEVAPRHRRPEGVGRGRFIAAPDVDAILIATPTALHTSYIEAAARAGKAVFCEKPIALDPERARACLEVVRETGARLMVGFNRRFDPDFTEVRRQIDAGRDRGRRARTDHLAGPGAAADQLRGALGRPVSRHDDPRLRHGPLPSRGRGWSRSPPPAPC